MFDSADEPGPMALVIDDDAGICMLIETILEQLGVRVEMENNGRVGLDRALVLSPDLLIVDQDLPLVDGATVIRRLRATGVGRRLPIIAVTGGGPAVELQAALAGATIVMSKPFRPTALADHVRSLLTERVARRANSGIPVGHEADTQARRDSELA